MKMSMPRLRKVQRGSQSVSVSGTSYAYQAVTITLPTPVKDMARSSVRISSGPNYYASSSEFVANTLAWALTSADTITVYVGIHVGGVLVIEWEVVEYYDVNVQRYCGTFTPIGGLGVETKDFPLPYVLDDVDRAEFFLCLRAGNLWSGGAGYSNRFQWAKLYSASAARVSFQDDYGAGTYYFAFEVLYLN